MAAPQRNKARYGLPFSGYQSSIPPHMAPADKATSEGPTLPRRSYNYRYNPLEGKFYRREGTTRIGATAILEDGTGEIGSGGKCRQLFSLRSASLTSVGYPVHASLWSDEANAQACVHFYNTNDNGGSPYGDQVVGINFGTTDYPATHTGGEDNDFKVLPYMRTTDGTLGRLSSLALRTQHAAGSRKVLDAGDWLYMPCKDSIPSRWNKRFNNTNGVGTENLRYWHTGRPSPLGLPTITSGTINSKGSWHEGDVFYVSVAYRFADGSVSMPIIPRDKNGEVDYVANSNHSGFGKISMARSGAGFDDRYLYLTWSTVPIGPDGCVGRYLLRTPKKNGTVTSGVATTTGDDPSQLDLRICAYLPNNTQTSYQDPNGNDLSLVADPLLVRFDHIMQPPARYIGTVDGRVLVGYTKSNPVAFYLCPDVNASDDNNASLFAVNYEVTLSGGTLTLKKNNSAGTAITCDNTVTVQQVVDSINNTLSAGSGGKWWACVAPGADSTTLCSTAGAANNNLTSTTSCDLGDSEYAATGRMRSYASSFYAPMFFSTTYLANFPTAKRRVAFTMGGPGMPPMAADSWAAGNFRDAPESYGDFVGSAPLLNGAVCCFSKGIMVLQNRKAGISGEDLDYRLWDLNPVRGCISWSSIVAYNGAVGYMTADGYVFTDGRDEVLISGDLWNATTKTGEWDYERTQSAAGSGADTDLAYFHAQVMGTVLYVNYRLTSSSAAPGHRVEYDFSGSAQFSGLRGVLRPDSSPWGWSTPLVNPANFTAMGEVLNASGVVRYAASDGRAGGMTATGRIYQIEVGTADDGVDIASRLWTARDIAGHLQRKSAQQVRPVIKKATGGGVSGLTLTAYRDGLGTTADATITGIVTAAGANLDIPTLPLPQAARAGSKTLEYLWADDGTGTDPPQIWGMEVDLLLLDSYD